MNTFKKNGGFTLVELIIVIAILAILSSVAVAGYSTYIKSANDSATESFLNEIKTHAILANAEAGGIGNCEVTVKTAATSTTPAVLTVKITFTTTAGYAGNFKTNFEDAFNGESNGKLTAATDSAAYYTFDVNAPSAWGNSSYKAGADWNGTEWTGKSST